MTTGSPWFRPANGPGPEPIPGDGYEPYAEGQRYVAGEHHVPAEPHAPAEGYVPTEPYVPAEPHAPVEGYVPAEPYIPAEPQPGAEAYAPPAEPYARAEPYAHAHAHAEPQPAPEPYVPADSYATAASYAYEEPATAHAGVAQESPYAPSYGPTGPEDPLPAPVDGTMPLRAVEDPSDAPSPGPGRAERRRAAKGGRGRSRSTAPALTPASDGRPLSRVEARRAARAAKESVGVVASRVVGELFITFGVVMLLFVTYQLWWTNVRAGQETDKAKAQIEDTWAKGGGDKNEPGAFEPGKGFAIMYIPKLDVVVPIAEGTSKTDVLDKGMVGHYGEGRLKTAMPADKQGNFAVAGHRNTHGEPFRYINQLKPGDPIVVETQSAYYTYEMSSILPQTSPSNVSVIEPVPKQSGFKGPGRYITLTTCTPEFTSTYRMIVWGKLVDERPRSKGKPEALVG
ncbi:class E sortase [Streptomyces sp. NPDC127166]|uniref:class E sortase n=1 Tax=Streptomyces sp. NPDC127166 TaxID=3345380 RepID=UPI00362C7070